MKFLQFAVGTVERAVTAGFADNMIASCLVPLSSGVDLS